MMYSLRCWTETTVFFPPRRSGTTALDTAMSLPTGGMSCAGIITKSWVIRNAVDTFVGDAEQFDDLTMMCLEYRGPQESESV